MRILVDQSGYDLLNLGDIAMLQSCVMRLSNRWPSAEIMVIANTAENLAIYCPGTTAIGRTSKQLLSYALPSKYRGGWRSFAPYFAARLTRERLVSFQPQDEIEAVRAADMVVAAGGGYLTDTWPWQATCVLSLLSLAQRLGKPTAMFGQGIGPLSGKILRLQACAVLPKLAVLGLREGKLSRDLAVSFGVDPSVVTITGDDALELAVTNVKPTPNRALGINVRVSEYSGVDAAAADVISELVVELAGQFNAPIIALPVARAEQDFNAITAMLRIKRGDANIVLADLRNPQDLIDASAECRTVVTGSYHAAVFALAQGIPAVCITRSDYYDAKFAGLMDLFPGAVWTVSLDMPDLPARLRNAIKEAWQLPISVRTTTRKRAVFLRELGRATYRQFQDSVERTGIRLELRSARPAGLPLRAESGFLCPAT